MKMEKIHIGTVGWSYEDSVEVFGYFSKFYSGYPPGDTNMMMNII